MIVMMVLSIMRVSVMITDRWCTGLIFILTHISRTVGSVHTRSARDTHSRYAGDESLSSPAVVRRARPEKYQVRCVDARACVWIVTSAN